MKLRSWAGYISVASLFGIILVWGFVPRYESWHGLSLLGLSAASLVLWIVLSLDTITIWLKRRSTQYFISLIITGIASAAILGVVNWAALKFNKKWDLTANQIHTLSEQSQKILGELKETITLRVWTTAVERISANLDMKRFLDNYKLAGKGKIILELKNPNEDPMGAKEDNVKRDNLIIIKAQSGRESRIDNFSDSKGEEQVTNAIIQAIKGSKKTVCFLSGHDELGIGDTGQAGLSMIRDRLNDSSYVAKEITLFNSPDGVPADCEALAIMGPKGDVSDAELKSLQTYLDNGGKMLAAFGPGTAAGWKKLISAYGVDIQNDFVIEPKSPYPDLVVTRNFSRDTEITKNSNAIVVFRESSTLKLPTAATFNGASVVTFISSEMTSIAKTVGAGGRVTMAPSPQDRKGPLPLAALVTKPVAELIAPPKDLKNEVPEIKKIEVPVEKKKSGAFLDKIYMSAFAQDSPEVHSEDDGHGHGTIGDLGGMGDEGVAAAPVVKDGPKDVKKETNLIVFSSAIFAANGVVRNGGNMDLYLNSISFLMKDQDLIGIRPRDMSGARLELTNRSIRQVYATIFFLSALFFFAAVLAVKRKFVRD